MEEVIQISEFSYVFIDRIHKDDAPRDLDSCFLIGVNFSHLFNMSRWDLTDFRGQYNIFLVGIWGKARNTNLIIVPGPGL